MSSELLASLQIAPPIVKQTLFRRVPLTPRPCYAPAGFSCSNYQGKSGRPWGKRPIGVPIVAATEAAAGLGRWNSTCREQDERYLQRFCVLR